MNAALEYRGGLSSYIYSQEEGAGECGLGTQFEKALFTLAVNYHLFGPNTPLKRVAQLDKIEGRNRGLQARAEALLLPVISSLNPTIKDQRRVSQRIIKSLRRRENSSPGMFDRIRQVLHTVADGDIGIMFNPAAEDSDTQKGVLEVNGLINRIRFLSSYHNNSERPNIEPQKRRVTVFKRNNGHLIIPPKIAAPAIFILANILSACSSTVTSGKISQAGENIGGTVQSAVNNICNPNTVRQDPTLCEELGGPESVGQPPSVQDAVEQAVGGVSMGDPLYQNLPESLKNAIEGFRTIQNVRAIMTDFNGESTEIGLNFADQTEDEQLTAVRTLIDAARDEQIPVQLEIGPGDSFNPCPGDTVCLKVDFISRDYKQTYDASNTGIGGENSFMAQFRLDINKVTGSGFDNRIDEIYVIEPFPTETGDLSYSVEPISLSAAKLLKPGGTYALYLNYYPTDGSFSGPDSPAAEYTDNMYSRAATALSGQGDIHYGPYDEMVEQFPFIENQLKESKYITDKNRAYTKVMVFVKK